MAPHSFWKRSGGIAATVLAGVASIATSPPIKPGVPPIFPFDAGTTRVGTATDTSAPFTVVLSPAAPTAQVTGTVTLSGDLTAVLALFQNEEGRVSLDLLGEHLSSNQSVDVSFTMTDDAGFGAVGSSGNLGVAASGESNHGSFGLDPDWMGLCEADLPCSARFRIQLSSDLTDGEIYVSGSVTMSVDATFGQSVTPSGSNFPGVEVVLDPQEPNGLDGG